MAANRIVRKLLFLLALTGLAVCPVPHFLGEQYFEPELINHTPRELNHRSSKQNLIVSSAKTILTKGLPRPGSTPKLAAPFLPNLFPTQPRLALSSTILLL